ncbi:DnaJ domain-containing protein [Lachnospiraceae bacterium 38-14]
MEEYYRILGLEQGAQLAEIKRAYFKLVRQFPPEKDPEHFQQIRKAYEQLTRNEGRENGPSFEALKDPLAQSMMKQITKARECGDDILFRDTAEEAWKYFPDKIQFLYLLVMAQRLCGNTGKAVKNGELLVKKDPGNPWFWRELAFSYMERGYTQKAFPALEKAYDLGIRDKDFILLYSEECAEYGETDKAFAMLREMVENPKDWEKEDLPEYMEAYAALLLMDAEQETSCFMEIGTSLLHALEIQGKYLQEEAVVIILLLSQFLNNPLWGEKEFELAEKIMQNVQEITDNSTMQEIADDEGIQEFIKTAQIGMRLEKLEMDARFGKTMRLAAEAFYAMSQDDMCDAYIRKFAITDTKLCMIMEKEEILKQAEILKQEYGFLYKEIEPFLQQLSDEKNLIFLKERLLKDYGRMYLEFNEGYFAEKYPQEMKRFTGTSFYEGDMPYVRTENKVGRNAPCPCGSGKKYKQCCGRK